jgi:hypothetical protein
MGQELLSKSRKCFKNTAPHTEPLHFHIAIFTTDELHERMVSVKAVIATQNLTDSKIFIWTTSEAFRLQISEAITAIKLSFYSHLIMVQVFDYVAEIKGTVLATNSYWSNLTEVDNMNRMLYADVVRVIALHNYGGVYLDNDALLLRDIRPLTELGLQFIPRFPHKGHFNGHIMHMQKSSPAVARMLHDLIYFRSDQSEDWPVKPRALTSWVYNEALPLFTTLLSDYSNTTSVSVNFFGLPISWFDPWWAGCRGAAKKLDEDTTPDEFQTLQNFFVYHSRWPKTRRLLNYSNTSFIMRVRQNIDTRLQI